MAGPLRHASFPVGPARLQRLDPRGLLLDDGEELDDQVLPGEGRVLPAGRVQCKPFWKRQRVGHSSLPWRMNGPTTGASAAVVIAKTLAKDQCLGHGIPLGVIFTGAPLNNYEYCRRLRNSKIPFKTLNESRLRVALETHGLLQNDELVLNNYPLSVDDEDTVDHFSERIIGNTWFEDYVFHSVLTLKDRCQLHDIGIGLETILPTDWKETEPYFEIDIVAMRGYQLFAISCTLDHYRSSCKEKLFEVKLRAEQLGGEETRIALACRVGKDDLNNLRILRKQLEGDNIKVFGYGDLTYLQNELEKWFECDQNLWRAG